jgi:serine/threonine protein kinase
MKTISTPEPGTRKVDSKFLLSPEDWIQAKGVLTIAADLTGTERARFVEEQFPSKSTLRRDLLSMLEIYDKLKETMGDRMVELSSVSPERSTVPSELSGEDAVTIGSDYGPYRVLQLLGAGGMGQVFLAKDTRLGRLVALKSVAGRRMHSRTARQRLLQEAQAIAVLSHPNIATLYDVLEDSAYLLLVMEYVKGRTVAAEVAEGPLSLGHAVRLAIQVSDAMVYAHDRGIIHCDLKPSNVQVSPDGSAKVLDFGIAHAKYGWYEMDDLPVSQGLLIGTPQYMPPERLLNGVLNASGDIYSLGVTLFEMVTGRRLFDESSFAALTGAILGAAAPRASSIAPSCPDALDEVLARALSKDPKQRQQTARELGRDLRSVLGVLDSETVAVPFPVSSHSPVRYGLRLPVLCLVAILCLTLTGFVTSVLYTSPLGVTIAFDGESPMWWPVWGLRALVVPLAQIGFTLIVFGIASQLWRMASDLPLLRRRLEPISSKAGHFLGWLRSVPTTRLTAGLLLVQLTALTLFQWRFSHLMEAVNNFILQSGNLAALASSHSREHTWYTRVLALLVMVFGLAWYKLRKHKSSTREPMSAPTLAAGTAMLLLTFFLMVAPYRLLFQCKGERVSYQSQLCYLVGKRENEASLFCPLQSPWSRLIDLTDPALQRSGTTEKIFSSWSER